MKQPKIKITLFADGEEVEGKKVQIKGDENEWTYTYENLPKYANGVEIIYTINETGVPQGYDSSKTGDMANGFTITNTHTPEVRDISVKKVWVDNDNQDGIRPTSIVEIEGKIKKIREEVKNSGAKIDGFIKAYLMEFSGSEN